MFKWRVLALTISSLEPRIQYNPDGRKMPTNQRIRDLCLRVTEAKRPEEFQAALLLLANALELYNQSQDDNGGGDKSAAASQPPLDG